MLEIAQSHLDTTLVKLIAKRYNPLDYSEKLNQLLSTIFPAINFKGWEKIKLHELVNEVIFNRHNGEQVMKYYLFKHFYKKNVVAAFEMKVNSSRVDFLTINGCTRSFEIKSGLDNLDKLKKQSGDYLLAFDYNYLVIDKRHLEKAIELIPSCFGIWSFAAKGEKTVHRDALLNMKIDVKRNCAC